MLCSLKLHLLLNASQYRHNRRRVPNPKPTLTCDVHCQVPVEDFHSIDTATSIPSYPGTEVDFSELEASSSHPHISHAGPSTAPRIFPVVVTNSDGQALFKADIEFSSNRVMTESSATTSTVSFSIDVVASLDTPIGQPPQTRLRFHKADLFLQYPSGTSRRKKTMASLTKLKTLYSSYLFEV